MIPTHYCCTAPASAGPALEACFAGEKYVVTEEDGQVTVSMRTIPRVSAEIADRIIELSKTLPDVVFRDHYCADIGCAYHTVDTEIRNGGQTVLQDFTVNIE